MREAPVPVVLGGLVAAPPAPDTNRTALDPATFGVLVVAAPTAVEARGVPVPEDAGAEVLALTDPPAAVPVTALGVPVPEALGAEVAAVPTALEARGVPVPVLLRAEVAAPPVAVRDLAAPVPVALGALVAAPPVALTLRVIPDPAAAGADAVAPPAVASNASFWKAFDWKAAATMPPG
jgi:hypothetical protein